MIPESFHELHLDNTDRSAYRRTWTLCMMPADEAAFSDALKTAFPRIRFVSQHYWEQFVDQERFAADWRERDLRWKRGEPLYRVRKHMRDPTGEPLHYWESLADPAEWLFIAWIEPPGWNAVWTEPDDDGVRYIKNTPRLWFEYIRARFITRRGGARYHKSEPIPVNGRETIELEGNCFEVRWNPREAKAEAFAKKVYNILRRLTVSRFIVFSERTRRAFTGTAGNMPRQCLAGRHAVAWAMRRRHNYFSCDNWGRILLKPAGYPLRQREIYTAAELRQHEAQREAELEAKIEAGMQAYFEEVKRRKRERAKSGAPATLDLLVEGGGGLSGLQMQIPIATIPPRKKGRKR